MKPLPLCRIYQYMNNMTYHHLSVLVHRRAEKYGDKVALKYRDTKRRSGYPLLGINSHRQFDKLRMHSVELECRRKKT